MSTSRLLVDLGRALSVPPLTAGPGTFATGPSHFSAQKMSPAGAGLEIRTMKDAAQGTKTTLSRSLVA
jgi:hypothetical protein